MKMMMMMIQRDGDDDGDDLPSSGRNFLGRFLPAGQLFSLSVFRLAEAAVYISDPDTSKTYLLSRALLLLCLL
jgi:hypothetical protein